MEARISSTRVRTTKGLIIYSFFFYILLLPQWRIQERGPWGPPFFPPPLIFLDQTEARRAEKKISGDRAPPTYLGVWMTAPPPSRPLVSRSGSGTVDLNGIRVAGGGEEGKRIKIVYISMTSSLALF